MIKYIYLIVSLLIFVFAPKSFSLSLCIVCALIFVLHFYKVISLENRLCKAGLISFNFLFALSAFAVVFVFPLFIYGVISDYSFRALSIFDTAAVNKVTALSTFGYSVYLIAYEHYLITSSRQSSYTKISIRFQGSALFITKFLAIISVVFFSINLIYFTRFVDSTHNDLTVNTYIAELTKCFLTICLICCCEKNKNYIKNSSKSFLQVTIVPIICFLLVMLEFLYIGDRGFVIVGGLTFLFVYSHYVKRLRAIVIIPVALAAIIIMSLVGQLRKTEASFREGGLSSFVSASNEIVETSNNSLDYISDLTLVSNVAYLEWDYSKKNKLYKPGRLLIIMANPIPLLPSLLSSLMYNDKVTSVSTGYAVTGYYNSQISNPGDGGLGTQLVMDLYMSWRLLGVIIGMWLLGIFMGKATAFQRENIYYLILLLTFFGLSIYLPRSTVYACFRTVLWEILFVYLITKVEKTKVRR